MNAIITGITGFAGSHLAEHLLACGDRVLGVARGDWPAELASLAGAVRTVVWDLADERPLDRDSQRVLETFSPDCIYHLAAISLPDECGEAAPTRAAQATNVLGTERVLALAARLPSPPRVLLASSSQVYAPVTREQPRVSEEAPLGPRRGYGLTKLAAEAVARQAATQGASVIVARAFQHTGPRQSSRLMLPQWARQYAEPSRAPVEVYTRDAYIDLTDVRDVVRAYRLLVEKGAPGITYNVGSGVCRRSGDMLDLLAQAARSARPVVETRPGPRQDPIADIGRLAATTGWRPEIAVEQTIADTWRYWRDRSV